MFQTQMSDADKILLGIIGTFIVSVVGWIFTAINSAATQKEQHKIQASLSELQEQFSRAREARQYLTPKQLGDLDKIEAWLEVGLILYNDLTVIKKLKSQDEDVIPGSPQEALLDSFAPRYRNWQDGSTISLVLAKQHETAPQPGPWNFNNKTIPEHLPSLVGTYILCIERHFSQLTQPDKWKEDADLEGKGKILYEACLNSIGRIRRQIVDHTQPENMRLPKGTTKNLS